MSFGYSPEGCEKKQYLFLKINDTWENAKKSVKNSRLVSIFNKVDDGYGIIQM